jgi:hypothetical protein
MKRSTLRKRRAVTSMLGATFFVIIIVSGLGLLLYNLAQHTLLQSSIATMEERSWNRLSEKLEVLQVRMSNCASMMCSLNITVFNSGGQTIHIVRMWITNQSYASGWQRKIFETSSFIDPATIETGIGSAEGKFDPLSTYRISLGSDRGNTFSALYRPNTNTLATAMGFGWLTMDWAYYNYTYATSKGGQEQGPYEAWCILGGTSSKTFLFKTRVLNHWDRDVYILSHSYLVFYESHGGGSWASFYVMSPSSTASQPVAYNPPTTGWIIVPANPADQQAGGALVELTFLASQAQGYSHGSWGPGSQGYASYAAFVILFYQDISGNTLAQTIPFEATEVPPSNSGSC